MDVYRKKTIEPRNSLLIYYLCYVKQEKVEVLEGYWFDPLKNVEGSVDGIVSNPPYIPSEHIRGLQPEVGRHEPRLALDGGSEGLDELLHICNGIVSLLKPGGYFALEVTETLVLIFIFLFRIDDDDYFLYCLQTNGEKQCMFLVRYIETKFRSSFYNINVVSDFAGVQRFITGFRH